MIVYEVLWVLWDGIWKVATPLCGSLFVEWPLWDEIGLCRKTIFQAPKNCFFSHMLGLLRRANHWSWKADKSRPRKPYTGRPQRLRKTDTLRDSGSRSCCLLYTSTVEGVQNTTATFSLRGCLNGFSVCFLSSPWPWLTVSKHRLGHGQLWSMARPDNTRPWPHKGLHASILRHVVWMCFGSTIARMIRQDIRAFRSTNEHFSHSSLLPLLSGDQEMRTVNFDLLAEHQAYLFFTMICVASISNRAAVMLSRKRSKRIKKALPLRHRRKIARLYSRKLLCSTPRWQNQMQTSKTL